MAKTKQRKADIKPIDLKEKVTMYAGKGAKFHAEGEETEVHPVHIPEFTKKGYSLEAPKAKAKA